MLDNWRGRCPESRQGQGRTTESKKQKSDKRGSTVGTYLAGKGDSSGADGETSLKANFDWTRKESEFNIKRRRRWNLVSISWERG